jgi:hypothetical protein
MPSTVNGKNGYGATYDDGGDDDPSLTSSSRSQKQLSEHPVHSMLGIGSIMLGSFSFSVMFLLVKLMEGTANSFILVFYRSLVQIVLSLASIIYNGENPLGFEGNGNRMWLLVRGGFGAGAVM